MQEYYLRPIFPRNAEYLYRLIMYQKSASVQKKTGLSGLYNMVLISQY